MAGYNEPVGYNAPLIYNQQGGGTFHSAEVTMSASGELDAEANLTMQGEVAFEGAGFVELDEPIGLRSSRLSVEVTRVEMD